MSITTTRNVIEKTGCGAIVAVVLAIVFVASLWYGAQNPNRQAQSQEQERFALATVGESKLTAEVVDRVIDLRQQNNPMMQFQGVLGRFQMESQAIVELVQQLALVEYGRQQGIRYTDEMQPKMIGRDIDAAVDSARRSMVERKQLKENATQAEFERAFEKENGVSLAARRTEATNQLIANLKDPVTRELQGMVYTARLVLDRFVEQNKATDAELTQSFQKLTLKRINFGRATSTVQDPLGQAQKALQEIKGGLKFEEAMKRYSKDQPTAGKTIDQVTVEITGGDLLVDEAIASLGTLQPGQVSEVLTLPTGPAIYKLVSKGGAPPANFAARKEQLREELTERKANAKLNEAIKPLLDQVKWGSQGYELAYDFTRFINGEQMYSMNKEQIFARLDQFIAKSQESSDPRGEQIAALVGYFAMEQKWGFASDAERKELAAQRIEALNRAVSLNEDFSLRMTLVNTLIEQRDPTAAEQLLSAARNNTDTTFIGQAYDGQIGATLKRLEQAKLGTPEQFAEIRAEQERWKKAKAEDERMLAEQRKEDERMKKEAEAEAAREQAAAEAEAKREAAGATSSPTTPTAPPANPPATTGATTGAATGGR